MEEMKETLTIFKLRLELVNSLGFKYNNTLYGLDAYNEMRISLTPQENILYDELDPFTFFNTVQHDNIIIIIGRIIKPIINELNDKLSSLFYHTVHQVNNYITIIIIIYFLIIIIWYFACWKRIENKVINSINKPKHMLLLLPKELLVELDNLHKVFNINQNGK